jgi:nucleotide-binding universal stress UspA family protein
MASGKERLLVAVDGSDSSLEVARYAAGVAMPQRTEVTLFHVLSPVSEHYWDLPDIPASATAWVREATAQRQGAMDAFMHRARGILLNAGFPTEAVRAIVQPRQAGVARDILREVRRGGYQAVAAGKTGQNPVTRLVMGSVAGKLAIALSDVTLWLVDGKPDPRRLLVCIDASPAAEKVVAHVGRMVSGSPVEITLFHAIRSLNPDGGSGAAPAAGGEAALREQQAREAMVPVFERSVTALEAAGIVADRISVKVISGVATRCGTLFAQALQGGYGTVVVGRRGVSNVPEFPIGRVPFKLVQLVKDLAVWVVSG